MIDQWAVSRTWFWIEENVPHGPSFCARRKSSAPHLKRLDIAPLRGPGHKVCARLLPRASPTLRFPYMSTVVAHIPTWWRSGVLARVAPGATRHLETQFAGLGRGEDRLPFDGLILQASDLATDRELLARAHAQNLRLICEWNESEATSDEELSAEIEFWLGEGVDGISVQKEAVGAPGRGNKVTQLFPTQMKADAQSPQLEAIRDAMRAHPESPLLMRLPPEGLRAGSAANVDLVIQTNLLGQPWRARNLGRAIEECERQLPAVRWSGYALGAPERINFRRISPGPAILSTASSLLLTLRGTPCLELGDQTAWVGTATARLWIEKLIGLRKRENALRRGSLRMLQSGSATLAYLREYQAERIAVLLNFARMPRYARLPVGFPWRVLLANDPACPAQLPGGDVRLPGHGVLIARAGAPLSRNLGGSGQQRAAGS